MAPRGSNGRQTASGWRFPITSAVSVLASDARRMDGGA
jgi:hypothetical protein